VGPPKDEDFATRWRALDRAQRRDIARAAGRGRADRANAALVAGFARQRLALWWEPWVGAVLVGAGFVAISLALWGQIAWVAGVGAVAAYLAVILWQRRRMASALRESEALLNRPGDRSPGRDEDTR
jgi:hypothetical protein